MFSHSIRDLSAIRFHSLDALILTTHGITVCSIVHSASTFAPCRNARPIQRPYFRQRWAQRGDPRRRTGGTKVTRVEGAEIAMQLVDRASGLKKW
jgi:hypothetical protein